MIHEVWFFEDEDSEEFDICFAGKAGDKQRKSLRPSAKMIFSFYAKSYYQAMCIYNKRMGWKAYRCIDQIDKKPYKKIINN